MLSQTPVVMQGRNSAILEQEKKDDIESLYACNLPLSISLGGWSLVA